MIGDQPPDAVYTRPAVLRCPNLLRHSERSEESHCYYTVFVYESLRSFDSLRSLRMTGDVGELHFDHSRLPHYTVLHKKRAEAMA